MIIISPLIKTVLRILSFAVFLVTILSCFGGYVNPNINAIPSVLTIGMPVMVTLTAAISIAWLCFGKWFTGGFGILTLILCATPIKMWFPLGAERKAEPGAYTFTVLTWNILHGEDLTKPDYPGNRTFETILTTDADIVCLQELCSYSDSEVPHLSQATLDSLFKKYPYRLGEGTYDCRILSKFPLTHVYFGSVNSVKLVETFTVDLPKRKIAMADIHLPSFHLNKEEAGIFRNTISKNKRHSTEQLGMQIIEKMKYAFPLRSGAAGCVTRGFEGLSMPTIVVGDFNDVPASWVYRSFLKAGFRDAYAETNFFPTNTYNLHGFYFHLDQVFYRGDVIPLSVKRLDIKTSDHYPLLATFELLD